MTTSLQSQDDFLKDADKGLIKPLYFMRELPGFDPASAFLTLLDDREPFLLESARVSPGTGRYSFMGSNPYMSFKCRGNQVEITREGRRSVASRPPLAKLRELMSGYRLEQVPGLPPFTGGCAGFISYDFVHNFEKIPSLAEDDLKIPDAHFIFIDLLAAYDHVERKLFIIANPGAAERGLGYASPEAGRWPEIYDKTVARMREFEERILSGAGPAISGAGPASHGAGLTAVPLTSKNDYERMVVRAKEYIAAGDIFQANLSQRLSADVEGIRPYDIYRVLREVNPSPFACYLDFRDVKIISSSPERLVRVEGGRVDTRPIAGTRPRGRDLCGDEAMRSELLLNEKERAEHIMLIDLERNDMGRVCEYGSVHVDELMVTEDYSHVIHIVSNVTGRLAGGKDAFDVIRAAFPGGTITGVPKVRCMEIIDELEPVARGPYTGSAGYIGYNGNMDLNIIIRTFVIKDNKAYVQVGAGIVADSDPEREYYETLHKAQALIKTLERL
jgi:aminodeoxychorismate synthase component I